MASQTPYTLRWGIMATGWIAETFCKDLLTNPAARGVHDVAHKITAVASLQGPARATSFLQKIDGPTDAATYGTYAELVADPDVDIIYVATPHSHHFQNAMLALEAGKNVLCEKAFTVTESQTRKLVEKARSKGLFLMEAVWTRYFPWSIQIRELVKSGAIGRVHRVISDLSAGDDKGDGTLTWDDSHRMVNAELAGGALLDLGIYALTWVFQILYHLQPEAEKEAPVVQAAVLNHPTTGTDDQTTIITHFPAHRSTGIALTGLRVATDPDGKGTAGPAIRIQGTKGEIAVAHPAYRPERYTVIKKDGGVEVVDCAVPKDGARGGHGMFWEADECARCLRDGKKESEGMPLEESIVIMRVMEQTWRAGGVVYPDVITTDVFDPQSPLNIGGKKA
ncbi:related to dimeric dihydrodiol dehydrogenase [Cephalotrichum gorgonifer]|uniref:D-xylose 1-dehydrogenase (NADP(+), D-xylono-1,5-lactone-forming) n=1 Tax=Cephalotrichum gorgonifer TaxID=2041049 RepID=A0AAE8MZ46_9PEZI|nr:related to dimeric dihydrodiol dehydrogenase [Cephalotrichum gorgonifer]